jgi:epoxide hydrolase 4
MPSLDHKNIEVNGTKVHYVTSGQGDLILFLHGFPEFWYEWRSILPEFAGKYQTVAPDMRGYNLSGKPAELDQYLMPVLVEDVKQLALTLLEGKPKKKFILVAHDWGGAVAWAFAIAHPEMLEKLVIINAPHPAVFARELRSNPEQQKASQYMLMFRSPEAEKILSADNYAALLKALHVADGDKQAYIDAWSQPGALTGGLNYYRANRVGPPTGEDAPKAINAASYMVKMPTLVIWGEKDTALLTANLIGLEAFVPDLKIERIADGTHWVINEQPKLVSRYIRDFISK